MKNIGAQLYTVRSQLNTKDEIKGTLEEIKEIGYDSVQLFGAVELISDCAECCKEIGLEITGLLANMNICEDNEGKLFEICHRYGIGDIGVSSRLAECQETDSYIDRINAFSAKAKQAGFTFSYHNHGHEFIKLAGNKTAMERFLTGFNPETVLFMPDTYWIQDGGYDVRYFLEQTKNRVKILHLKDMKRIEQGHTFTEVGNGNLYFEGILKTALACGIQNFVVEQDICEGDPLESLRKSYEYIKKQMEGCV